METTKTDNTRLADKIALRRWFLQKYHAERVPVVWDCCQGQRRIWDALRREFRVAYQGADRSPRRAGGIKLESTRLFDLPGWRCDVVDIDTYGEPWRHYEKVCRTASAALTCFLTVGQVRVGGGRCSEYVFRALGLPDGTPHSLASEIAGEAIEILIWFPLGRLRLVDCREMPIRGRARYFGLRLEPANISEAAVKRDSTHV